MSYGDIIPYLRRKFSRERRFSTGSLLFDVQRQMHRKSTANAEPQRPSIRS